MVLILLTAGSLIFALPQPFRFISGFLQAFVLPGMLFSIFVLGARISGSERLFLSLLLSPVLFSILVATGGTLTGDIYLSATIVLIACYIILIIALILRKDGEVKRNGDGVPRQIYMLSLIYGSLILLSYLANGYLLIRSDAWYHASVVQEIASRGIPPNEPLIADVPIRYMWFYHLFQAIWIKLSGTPLFWAMGTFNITSAFMFPYIIARFVSCFTDRKPLIVFATLLTVIGLDAASWILYPVSLVRAFAGEVSGMEEVRRILSSISFNGADVIYFLAPYGTWTINFSDKFLTITIFNYSLNLFLAAVIVTLKRRIVEDSRLRSSILLFVILLGVFLFHVITGLTLIGAIVGSSILMYIMSRHLHRDNLRLRDFSALLITAMLVAALAAIYFLSLTAQGNNAPDSDLMTDLFHFGYTNVLTILFPLLILFIPARDAFRKIFFGSDYQSRMLVCWIICLLMPNVFINIGTNGENRFVYFLFLLIGPPIFIQIGEKIKARTGARRNALIVAIAVLFLVPPILTFRGFIMEAPSKELGSRRSSITDEDWRFFRWVDGNTPKDAVIVENNIYHLCPVYAGRRNFYSWYEVVKNFYGGEKIRIYGEIQASIYGKEELTPEIIEAMRALEQKLYIAVWWEDIESSPWLTERFNSNSSFFDEEYRSDRVALFSLRNNALLER